VGIDAAVAQNPMTTTKRSTTKIDLGYQHWIAGYFRLKKDDIAQTPPRFVLVTKPLTFSTEFGVINPDLCFPKNRGKISQILIRDLPTILIN
jgi:hypothetical protein